MIKFYEGLFQITVTILTVLSFLALIVIHFNGYRNGIQVSIAGVNDYLNLYQQYSALFGATIAALALLFGLLRLKEATITNHEKIKQDLFNEWKLS